MITIYWPQTPGEMLAFGVAAITALLGIAAFLAPRFAFRLTGLTPARADAVAEGRATLAAPYIALGVGAILFAQPFVTLVLGAAWALAAAGRALSMVADRAASAFNAGAFAFEALMAAGALAAVLGWVA
jgi:hypothetical protein